MTHFTDRSAAANHTLESSDASRTEARHVVLSVNPFAGRRSVQRRVDELVAMLRKWEYHVDVSTSLDEAVGIAIDSYRQGRLRALVGVGGDGTVGELVNRTPIGLPLTFLPTGTANLLAKHFRLKAKPAACLQVIREGVLLNIDAGRAGDRLFVVMASCGFDAAVVEQVHRHRQSNRHQGHIGYTSYLKPIWRSIRNYRFPEIEVRCRPAEGSDENTETQWAACWVFVSNFPRYGWGVPVAPGALPNDGLLDLCTLARGSLWRGLWYATCLQLGGAHRFLRDCTIRRGQRFRLTCSETVPYQLDGDPGGTLPVEIEVVPARVTLLVPPGSKHIAEASPTPSQ